MVDTPFVDENFQRAYRNTFKSQVSSGRDLHVSDVVIPVVDFSPTTAGTSLALNLRQARNIDGTNITLDQGDASTTFQDLPGAGTGFYELASNMATTGKASWQWQITDGSTSRIVAQIWGAPSNNFWCYERIVVYIPTGFSLQYRLLSTDGNQQVYAQATLLADVNGNEVLPFGYNPQ